MIFVAMILLGSVIGFVGAGGAGVTITLLTVGFGVPVHTALAVALAAMTFTMISGTVSHYREHEVDVKPGAIIGGSGMIGSIAGANVSNIMPSELLATMTSLMLIASGLILYVRLYQDAWLTRHFPVRTTALTGRKLYIYGIITGLIVGFLSGAFGIGAAAFIQLALMVVFGISLLHAIGTCMMIVLPISAAGGLSYLFNGRLDLWIFVQTLLGLSIGAYIGAKFTHLAPKPMLKAAIVAMPTLGGIIMVLFGR